MEKESYTIEQSMDVVLEVLINEFHLEFSHLQSLVGNKHFRISMLKEMLLTLERDGYVHRNDNGVSGREEYSITNAGKMFLRDGGYVNRKEKELEKYRHTIETLVVAKQGLSWSKIAGITGIIAIILSVLAIIISVLK